MNKSTHKSFALASKKARSVALSTKHCARITRKGTKWEVTA